VEIFIGIIVVLWVLSIPALWIALFVRRDGSTELRMRLAALEQRVAALQWTLESAAATPAAIPPESHPTPPPADEPTPAPAIAAEPASAPAPSPVEHAPGFAHAAGAASAQRESVEQWIMRRWAAWLGALALALGGVFLVKYSFEQGFFGPTARVVAGVILGCALLVLSEATRRRPLAAVPLGHLSPDYVPPALAASGTVVLFASLYAAYALYDLLPGTLAFPLLAAVALGGAALSLVHGVLLAWLGLAGAYAVPLLVTTPNPSVARLLAYVLAVTAGCLWLVRWRDWPWLGGAAVAGSGLWTVAALSFATAGDEIAVGLYLVVLAPLFLAAAGEAGTAWFRDAVMWSGAAMVAGLIAALALWADTDRTSLAFVWLLTAFYAAVGVLRPRFDRLPWLAALLQALVLAGWNFAPVASADERLSLLLALPPQSGIGGYLTMAALAAGLAGFGGFFVLERAGRPDRWAVLSAATPLAVLAIVYWRIEQLAASLPWAAAAFLLAAAFLAAVEYVARRRSLPGFTNAPAYYALATTGAVALALTLSLRLGWLSVALSLELPAMAWLHERTGVHALRAAALVVGIVVLARLLLNPAIVDYELGSWPLLNGLLYTYGIPAAAFAASARWFRRSGEDATTWLLEAGALALGVALVSLELRHLMSAGRLDAGPYSLLEQAMQTDAWLALSYALLPRPDDTPGPVRAMGWRVIAAVASLHLLLFQCFVSNPLWAREDVGAAPLLDVLLLAYAVPAGFAALYYRALSRPKFLAAANGAGLAALALAFLYISLEVRHLFHGSHLDHGGVSDGEWYAYSAAWLAYGAALLVAGLWRSDARLRMAGLAIGALVAVKAFGFDMAALTGLYRAASFLGLGASLVALARLYQHMTNAPAAPSQD
jgi:uncharacterized membrane protein